MDYRNIDCYILANMVTEWLRYAGPNARKEFLELIHKTDYDRKEKMENYLQNGYVFDFAVDHSDVMCKAGRFLVYLFVDEEGEIYYVGMGDEYRIMGKKNRNKKFLEHYMKHNSKIVILSKWSTRKIALEIEKMAILRCQINGFRLTNIQGLLSFRQLHELRNIPKSKEDYTEIQHEYIGLVKEFSDEVKALDRIEQWLYEDGARKTPGYVNVKEDAV